MAACGGGGGNTPTASRTIILITPTGGDPIASDDAAGLVPEEINGSGADGSDTAPVFLGTITDNKDQSGNVTYRLVNPDDVSQTYEGDFEIRNGNQLFYIGAYSGDYATASEEEQSFPFKIERTDGGNVQTLDYIARLQEQIEVLTITPPDSDTPIPSGGTGLIPEEKDGSGAAGTATAPIPIGQIKDSTTAFGVTYKLVPATDPEDYESDNLLFSIGADGVTIFYVGPAVDFDTALASAKTFTISIERVSSAGFIETFRYVTNLKDLVEVLTITPDGGEAILSDGTPLIDENADGSGTRIEIGTIGDTIQTSTPISYSLAESSKTNFEIDNGKLYYTGSNAGDFDVGDKLVVDVIRTINGNAATDQAFQYVINLKNLDDESPIVAVEGGNSELPILADFSGMVGTSATAFTLTLNAMPASLVGNSLNVVLTRLTPNGDAYTSDTPTLSLAYKSGTERIEKLTIQIKQSLRTDTLITDLKAAFMEHPVLGDYFGDVVKIGTPTFFGFPEVVPNTLTTIPILQVDENTSGTIATFTGIDPDGDLSTLTFADLAGADAALFNFDKSTGALSFINPPDFENTRGAGSTADNTYDISVTVSDGVTGHTDDTYSLQVVVKNVVEAGESLPSAAESVYGDDDFALPPLSHGMDDGEAVPNKIHLNEAYYAGSYDAYLDYLQFILDGGDPSVGGLLIGPSTDEILTPDADEPTPSPEEKPEQPKKLQAMLDAIGAAEQSAPAPDPHQWQPNSYNDDSDLDPITPTDPDIL